MPLKPPLYISYLLKKLFKTELKSLFIVLGLYFFLQGIPNLIKLQIQFGGDFYFIIILSVSILLLTLPLFLPISSILAVFLFRYEIKKLGLFSNLELLGKKSTNVFWIKQSFRLIWLSIGFLISLNLSPIMLSEVYGALKNSFSQKLAKNDANNSINYSFEPLILSFNSIKDNTIEKPRILINEDIHLRMAAQSADFNLKGETLVFKLYKGSGFFGDENKKLSYETLQFKVSVTKIIVNYLFSSNLRQIFSMDIKKSFYLIFSSFLAGVFIFMSIKPGLYLSYFKGAVIFGSFLFSLNFLKIFSIESLSKQTFINSLMVLLILFVISFFMSLKKIWAEDDIT